VKKLKRKKQPGKTEHDWINKIKIHHLKMNRNKFIEVSRTQHYSDEILYLSNYKQINNVVCNRTTDKELNLT
jgi:hypothetical protein